jgi:AcrR family transcriptional regulator
MSDEVEAFAPTRALTHGATRIVDEVVRMLGEMDVHEVRVGEVARRAGVAIPTIYYNFRSLDDLIAEATVVLLTRFLVPFATSRDAVARAIVDDDALAFAHAARRYIEGFWTLETVRATHRFAPLIAYFRQIAPDDVRLRALQVGEVTRQVAVLSSAQERGWIDPADDVRAFVIVHWTCVLGQCVFYHPSFGPLTALDFSDGVGRLRYRTSLHGDIDQWRQGALDTTRPETSIA